MIVHLIDTLPAEVTKVILAVNYKKDQIERYFKDHAIGKEVIVNDEPEPLGTGGAVKFAERHITGPFLVMNSDIICSLDLTEMIQFHRRNNAVSTISLWPVENVAEFGVVDIRENGNVVGFIEKPKPEDAPSNLINAGAYCLEPAVLDYIETGRLVSMEKKIFPQIINDTGKFFGFEFGGFWTDVGRITSYIDANKLLLKHQKVPFVTGDNCTIFGRVTGSSIGDNVVIGESSRLESTVVFDQVTIGKNVVLDHCVIGERCEIGDDAQLKYVVVGDHEHISDHTVLENHMVWTQPVPVGYPAKQIGNVIGE